MSIKRPSSPSFIPNPFIKKQNLAWTLDAPIESANDAASSSPDSSSSPPHIEEATATAANTAAIESGSAAVTDHLALFSSTLAKHALSDVPVLPISSYQSLYSSNVNSDRGAHFVIHQHDHPVAGTHYDLRLQINETSSVSWAIMYGLPGDPNSQRLNRNATETRIHCLWNHLIETASAQTGSLLIWDTGTYSVLPYKSKRDPAPDPSSPNVSFTSDNPSSSSSSLPSPQSLLHDAFQRRKIRLRLHGTRLPDPYILHLRLTKNEDAAGRAKSSNTSTKRPRRRRIAGQRRDPPPPPASTDSSDSDIHRGEEGQGADEGERSVVPKGEDYTKEANVSAMERELREMEDEQVRLTNAYPGASNTIGSVHQRRWYLSLDRVGSGFVKRKRRTKGRVFWGRGDDHGETINENNDIHDNGDEEEKDVDEERRKPASGDQNAEQCRLSFPFYVHGADSERSVVTGRTGAEILRDESVTDFKQRRGWKPVVN